MTSNTSSWMVFSTVGAGISESTHLHKSSTYRFVFLVMLSTRVASSGSNYRYCFIFREGYRADIVEFDCDGIFFAVGDLLLKRQNFRRKGEGGNTMIVMYFGCILSVSMPIPSP
jgi:hypothetical protein